MFYYTRKVIIKEAKAKKNHNYSHFEVYCDIYTPSDI